MLSNSKHTFTTPNVSSLGPGALGLVDQLVAEDHDQVQRNAQVSSNEVLVVKRAVGTLCENGKVLGDCNNAAPEESKVRAPFAEGCLVGKSLGVNALSIAGIDEVDVRD